MSASIDSAKELREVIDEVFRLMDADPEMGPKLRDADTPQRFEFSDFDLVVNVRATRDGEEGNLHWEWSDEVDWKPKVKMTMSSEIANSYFQGKENAEDGGPAAAHQDRRRHRRGAQARADHRGGLPAVPRVPRAREDRTCSGVTPSRRRRCRTTVPPLHA